MTSRSRSRLARPAALAAALALTLGCLAPGPAQAARRKKGHPASVLLDGQETRVRWTDGDSFQVDSGPLRGFSTRLLGYNTLEAFGPVHRVGALGPEALYDLARGATALVAAGRWTCRTTGERDGYGRALVACPDAAAALLRAGQAMVFAVGGPADPALLEAQRQAQAARAGLWAGGVPPEILTSLHSTAERGAGGQGAYDRVVDTRTGQTRKRAHREAYRTCQEVCLGEGTRQSCLTYVPFERRYRGRPACLGPPRPE
ncbi:MAG: nuclease [Anaeromyxobacter sp.]|nr:nuclease [Anaeromyxobacter sp.]